MLVEYKDICDLRIRIAVLEEKNVASAQALKLAENLAAKFIENKSTTLNYKYTHIIAIIGMVVFIVNSVAQFFKKQ